MQRFWSIAIVLLVSCTCILARSYGLQKRLDLSDKSILSKCKSLGLKEGQEVFTTVLSSTADAGTIKFDDVRTNEGHSYKKKSGVFKAKKNGIYAFFWTAISSFRFVTTELHVQNILGDVVVASAISDLIPDAQFTQDEVANSVTINLNAGDEVSVVSTAPLQKESTFSGFRVNTDFASAFHARSVQQITNATAPTVFDYLTIDTQEEFDGANFTATKSGLYVFTVSGSTFARQVNMDLELSMILDGITVTDDIVQSDEEWEDDDEIYNKAASNTIMVQLNTESNDIVSVELSGNSGATILIDKETSFSGFLQFQEEKPPTSAVTLIAFGTTTCNPQCVAFLGVLAELDVNNDFNSDTGEFIVREDGIHAIAISFESRDIPTTYNIEVNDKILYTGQNTGPMIPEESTDNWCSHSTRVVFEYLYAGDVVKITLTGSYRTGSSLSIWRLPEY